MMKQFSALLLLVLPISLFAQHALLTADNGDKYLAGVINFKVDATYRSACSESAIAIPEVLAMLEELGLQSLKKKFPRTQPPTRAVNDRGLTMADISLIYEARVSEDVDIIGTAKKLSELEWIVYAEPQFVNYDMYVPNDANLNSVMPYHFDRINAYEAWDITLGDTNVVIGITETAINVNHQDLSGNIKYNYADPVGGGDDDNDGYVDNFAGWDMVDNDNNLFINNEIHGDAVSAIASATADNSIGYAGIGFKCKFLPVKVANNSQVITHGYEGIQYCVEHGCSVVNCSWGNTTYSQVAQDIVTWAAINNDVVLVASAGNANSTSPYYPASYNYVLSVTGVDQNDVFDNGTNAPFTHNDSVDVSAPGINVYTTATFNGQFLYSPPQGGTSMASPIVAGVAGLVRSSNGCAGALEVIEHIKATADNVDGISQNVPYAGLIGTGRVNAQTAVTTQICIPTSVQGLKAAYVEIYPNPSTQDITIRMSVAGTWNIDVLDAEGRVVLNEQMTGNKLVLSGLASGLYVARVSNSEHLFSKRFAVVRP
jgi:subtilisin family serine protease